MLRRFRFSVLLFSLLGASGCTGQPDDIPGPNGYGIACDKGRDCFVAQSSPGSSHQTIIIDPIFVSYSFVGNFIVGRNKVDPQLGPSSDQKEGYFIVNTLTGTRQTGLTEAQLHQILQWQGINDFHMTDTGSKGLGDP